MRALTPTIARLLAAGLALGGAAAGVSRPALADPLPLPSADFTLKAKLHTGGEAEMAHSGGRMRVEMTMPKAPGAIVGILDIKGNRMVMMVPNLPKMAVEIELPPEYSIGAMTGTGTRTGTDTVAGQLCDLWVVDLPAGRQPGSTVACITSDGIVLRTVADVKGERQVLYEATDLKRGPQDPKLFQVPAGIKVMKVPKGAMALPGALPGLGAPAATAAPAPAPAAPAPR